MYFKVSFSIVREALWHGTFYIMEQLLITFCLYIYISILVDILLKWIILGYIKKRELNVLGFVFCSLRCIPARYVFYGVGWLLITFRLDVLFLFRERGGGERGKTREKETGKGEREREGAILNVLIWLNLFEVEY